MTKMDMIWVAVASMLHPSTLSKQTVTRQMIAHRVLELFGTVITPVVVEKHLVSSIDRQADKNQPSRGGSRNRYLFRTHDGSIPSMNGGFRLYKAADTPYDAHEKTAKTHPEEAAFVPEYRHYVLWYTQNYLNSQH